MSGGLILAAALLCQVVAGSVAAQGELTRNDTAAILFSNRFSFTPAGEPILSVRLMEDQEEIRFSSADGLVVYPSGPEGPALTVRGKVRGRATLTSSHPARLGYRVVLGSAPTSDFAEAKSLVSTWKQRGIESATLDLGALFSFRGTVFDTRVTLVCETKSFATRKEARARARILRESWPGKYTVQEVLEARPEGTIRLELEDAAVRLDAANAIWLSPSAGELTVQDVEYARGFPWHGRQTRRYSGSFYLAVDRYGKLAIVNVLPAEKLLKGLVPAEIYADSPDAALRAQAVAARNELLSKIGHRHLADPYLLCADQHCQVYKGLDAEAAAATAAVDATRGEVMFDEAGALADSRYHSTCGGHTEDGGKVWPGNTAAGLAGRWDSRTTPPDPFAPVDEASIRDFLEHPPKSWCSHSAKSKASFRWTRELTAAEVDDALRKQGVGSVRSLEVLERGSSGRILRLRVTGTKGEKTISGELRIRKLFGGLKSSLFVVEPVKSSTGAITAWRFVGGGFGHGAGMCQVGAHEMGRAGRSDLEILQFYYRGVTVKRIY